jgi:hypothetical protein
MHGALTYAFARADLTEVVRQIERLFSGSTFSVRSLFHDEQAAVLERLLEGRTAAIEETYAQIYDQTAPLLRFLFSLDQPPPPVFHAAAEFTLMARLRRALGAGTEIDLALVGRLLEEAAESRVALDPVVLGRAIEGSLRAILDGIRARPDDLALLQRAVDVAGFVSTSAWKIDLGEAQTAVWRLLRSISERPSLPYPAPSRDERRVLLERVAVRLRIRVDHG